MTLGTLSIIVIFVLACASIIWSIKPKKKSKASKEIRTKGRR